MSPQLGGSENVEEDHIAEEDNWESVKTQPVCVVCGIVFSTETALEKHVKYSDVHAANVAKLAASDGNKVEDVGSEPREPTTRCKVMYTGSKFFWRTGDHIDLHIYLHLAPNCIEVIAYDEKADIELPRLYLKAEVLAAGVNEAAIQAKLKEYRAKATIPKNYGGKVDMLPDHVLLEEERRQAMASHILGKIQVSVSSNGAGADVKTLSYADNRTSPALLPSKPDDVIPVSVARRRQSSDAEIRASFDRLDSMQSDVREITARAERILQLLNGSVKTFADATKLKRQLSNENLPRRRWKMAIHKVILQNEVKRVTEHLLSFGDKFYIPPTDV
eukprot:CAMPEP_0185035948 /NCGR_PEP_ID=MMETSP1103-20130426/28144_1 /TAXON_ID=36769 /ORGANISM="Paraphysomonas bandaiensis, Strain Caron Lab Isolate" /LENGTH=331 /DNA_ID=CAMNT_0027573265 /DNA_START=252 /DNA_END=1247 /DNA_ORIENTATION=+